MGFIELLNKYGQKISVEKTSIYRHIYQMKDSFAQKNILLKINDEFDLFAYEIIYRGIMNQNYIENAYEVFLNQNYDLLDYLKYDEKQRMFNNDIHDFLRDAPCFVDEKTATKIYIPYLEPFVNKRYTDDYQMLLLKQHRDYIRQYPVQKDTPISLYGKLVYLTRFSSLELVYEDQRHMCLYYDELKKIYIFNKKTEELLNSVVITDCDSSVELEHVKKIALCLENYQYDDCLELLVKYSLIGQKTYKKIKKRNK